MEVPTSIEWMRWEDEERWKEGEIDWEGRWGRIGRGENRRGEEYNIRYNII